MNTPLSSRALRSRWAVARLGRRARSGEAAPPAAAAVAAMGLVFPSPVGLAAGFDRRGALLPLAHHLGLGAVEMGSLAVTTGACAPSRSGPRRGRACRGLSLARPPSLAWEAATPWFAQALARHHGAADYLTLNPGRGPPDPAAFAALMAALAQVRETLPRRRRLPLVAKLPAAWLAGAEGCAVARGLVAAGADGLLVSAEGAAGSACHRLAELAVALGPGVCLISVGGIASVAEARARLAAGASLVQVHRRLLGCGAPALAFLAALAGLPGRRPAPEL